MQFLEPKSGKICTNLVKKLLPAGRLTIIMINLAVMINGYQGQTKPVKSGLRCKKMVLTGTSEQCSTGN
jgi:hypothetical protein